MNDDERPLDQPNNQPSNNQPEPQQYNQNSTPQSNVYEGPVAQTTEKFELSDSYNSSNLNVHKSHKRQWEVIIFALLLIATTVGVILLLGSRDSGSETSQNTESQDMQSAIETDENEESNSIEEEIASQSQEAEESQDLNESVIQMQAKGRDVKRKSDINTMYQKLEEHFNENGYYPTEQFSASLFPGTDPEVFIDTNGVRISQLSKLSTEKPESPYTPGEEPVGSEYSYIAYQCTSPMPGEGKCNGYVLYGWLETEESVYVKQSLN